MRKSRVQKRLQEYEITGITGQADERKAKFILLKKRPPSETDSRALFKEKLRELNARMVREEKIRARKYAHEKKLRDKIRRKEEKHNRRLLRQEIVFTEKIKGEAKRIFAAKPYDPHKKERGKVKWG